MTGHLTYSNSQELEPEKVRGAPLCMNSYKWLYVASCSSCNSALKLPSFHSSRYPTKPSDTAQKFDPSTHNHAVFVRKNKYFKVPLTDDTGRELSAAELEVCVVIPPCESWRSDPFQTNR